MSESKAQPAPEPTPFEAKQPKEGELSDEDLAAVAGGRGVITLSPSASSRGIIVQNPDDVSLGGPDTNVGLPVK